MAADLRSPRPLAEAGDTVSSTPMTLSDLFSPQVLGRAKSALLTVTEEPIFYRFKSDVDDGEANHVLAAGQAINLPTRGIVKTFSMVAVSSDAEVFVTLFT